MKYKLVIFMLIIILGSIYFPLINRKISNNESFNDKYKDNYLCKRRCRLTNKFKNFKLEKSSVKNIKNFIKTKGGFYNSKKLKIPKKFLDRHDLSATLFTIYNNPKSNLKSKFSSVDHDNVLSSRQHKAYANFLTQNHKSFKNKIKNLPIIECDVYCKLDNGSKQISEKKIDQKWTADNMIEQNNKKTIKEKDYWGNNKDWLNDTEKKSEWIMFTKFKRLSNNKIPKSFIKKKGKDIYQDTFYSTTNFLPKQFQNLMKNHRRDAIHSKEIMMAIPTSGKVSNTIMRHVPVLKTGAMVK